MSMDCEADCKQQQLQREQNSTIELMSSVLSRAFLEWILMFLLYINALFSFLVTQFAHVCKLQTPCLLCSRLDHVLLPGPAHYNDLICDSHKRMISDITYVEKKNDTTLKQCYCSVPLENSINDDDKWMIVRKPVENSDSDYHSEDNIDQKHEERRVDEKHEERIPHECIKHEPVSLMLPAGDAIVDSTADSETVSKENFESTDDKLTCSGNLITRTSTTDPDAVTSQTTRDMGYSMDLNDAYNLAIGSKSSSVPSPTVTHVLTGRDSDYQSEHNIDEMHEERRFDEKHEEIIPHECIKPEPVSLMLPAGDTIVDSTADSETVSKGNFESIDDKLTGSGNLITPTSTNDPNAITSQTTRDMGYNMDLNDAYKLAVGSQSSSAPSPTVTQVLTGRDSSKVYEDLRLLVSQFSAARGLESPWTELSSPSPRVLHDPSNKAILEHITKSLSIDRNESGFENLDRSSSIAAEIEGESAVDRLKRQIELDRKSMYLLYKELEEERNASAVAAYQTMAMITRLQEEKASMHMEALQYQRMMEEQSEYDQEAMLKLNQVVLQREKEIQDLEAQLAYFRKIAGDDFVLDKFEKSDV